MKYLLLIASLAIVGGCTKTVEEMSYSERKALSSEIVKRCMAQGVKLNTKEMDTCLYVEAQREVVGRRNSVVRQRQAAAAIGAGLQGYSNGAAASYSANRPINCTSTATGTFVGQPNRINTTCY